MLLLCAKRTEKESLLGVVNEECTVALTRKSTWEFFEGQSQVNGQCNLEWVGRMFRVMGAGFSTTSDSGTKCTSLIRGVLHLHLGEMESDDTLSEFWSEYLSQVSAVDCSHSGVMVNQDGDHGQLRLENMAGTFVLHCGLSLLAIVPLGIPQARFKIWNRLTCTDSSKNRKKPLPISKSIRKHDFTTSTPVVEERRISEAALRVPEPMTHVINTESVFLSDVEYYDGDVDDQVPLLRREINRMNHEHEIRLQQATVAIYAQLTEMMAQLLKQQTTVSDSSKSDFAFTETVKVEYQIAPTASTTALEGDDVKPKKDESTPSVP